MKRRARIVCAFSVMLVLAGMNAVTAGPLRSGFAADVTGRTDFRDLGRVAATEPVTIVAALGYRHPTELTRLVELQSNPRSPFYHHWLTNAQFNAYFAPARADYARVAAALQRAGFRITGQYSNRTLIDAVAPAFAAERYFRTEIHRVAQRDAGVRYANVRPAQMPADLRGLVDSISGLDDLIVAKPAIAFAPTAGRHIAGSRNGASKGSAKANFCFIICAGPTPTPQPTAAPTPTPKPTSAPTPTPKPTIAPTATPRPTGTPTAPPSATPQPTPTAAPSATPTSGGGAPIGGPLRGPDNGYGPIAVANGYDSPAQHGYNGSGRATGIAISGDYSDQDLSAYLGFFGITRTGTTTRVEVDGGATYNSSFSTSNASVEATLDVETIAGNAPGTNVYMYLFPDLSSQHIEDGYNRAVSDGIVDVLNSSFGGCETSDTSFTQTTDSIAVQGAAKGITFAASSGDSGSAECGTSLLGFGGSTGVSAPASGPHFVALGGTSFNVNANGSYASETAWSGSGGGVSTVFAEPSYQSGIASSTSGRNVPDLAYGADPNTGTSLYFGSGGSSAGWNGPIGGTSWSCPIYSAIQTEVNQRLGTRSGFVNPRIYNAFRSKGYAVFHDITSGSNGAFSAGPGYDDVTGIGSTQSYAFSGVE